MVEVWNSNAVLWQKATKVGGCNVLWRVAMMSRRERIDDVFDGRRTYPQSVLPLYEVISYTNLLVHL
jgi:hypothetical protein